MPLDSVGHLASTSGRQLPRAASTTASFSRFGHAKVCALAVVGAATLLGCRTPLATKAPAAGDAQEHAWIDADVLIADPGHEKATLSSNDAPQSHELARRLDRLLDLYDAARLAAHLPAREALWLTLGQRPHPDRGPQATRAAALRLLQEAWTLDAMSQVSADDKRFVAGAIHLLSLDAQPPTTAEELATQNLALTDLAGHVHPRLADNLAWRRLDMLMVIAQAADRETDHRRRLAIARAGIYTRPDWANELAQSETVPAWLVRPTHLLTDFDRLHATLPGDARWSTLQRARLQSDRATLTRAIKRLPLPRETTWPLPQVTWDKVPSEDLGPLVQIDTRGAIALDGVAVVDAAALSAAVGSQVVTAVLAPDLPAPHFNAFRQAIVKSQAPALALAVASATRPPPREGVFLPLAALPLQIERNADKAPRVIVHLRGADVSVSLDQAQSSAQPANDANLIAVAQALEEAYPDEARIGVALAADASVQQCATLVAALLASSQASKRLIYLVEDFPTSRLRAGQSDLVWSSRRAWRGPLSQAPTITNAESMSDDDLERLRQGATQLALCLPELQTVKQVRSLAIALRWQDDELLAADVITSPRVDGKTHERLRMCALARMRPFALQAGNGERAATIRFSALHRP